MDQKDALRNKLKLKIRDKQIQRGSKRMKKNIAHKTMKKAGVDTKLFDQAIQTLQNAPQKQRDQILNERMKKLVGPSF